MEDWKGFISNKTRDDNIDFEEEDMWTQYSLEDQHDHYSSPTTTTVNKPILLSSGSSSSSSSWKLSNKTTPKSFPRRAQTTTKTIEAKAKVVQVQQSSAPMKIPDWSKIYGKSNNASWACDDHDHDHDDGDHDVDDDDDVDNTVPPHEWIARKLARSQISSFSVCEGIGRTLKGRDLSKLRNAILTKTGFLE